MPTKLFTYIQNPLREHHGILDFAKEDFYWGLVDRGQMKEFLVLARSTGYSNARKNFDFKVEKKDKLIQYIDSMDRADFHFLLPASSESVVMDLGSGYGNITIPLARHFKKVIAVDTSLELLEFVKLRAESEGITNIEYIHVDPFEYCNLPIPQKSVDLVTISGVLEWVGPAKKDESPIDLQKKFLAQIRALLKDDGVLYLAIENRWFPGYAYRDPHSKLPYTVYLPRVVADWYAKKRGQKDGYRTYIYGYRSYQKMLKSAGFGSINFYIPYTGYRNPSIIWPNNVAALRFLLGHEFGKRAYTWKWQLALRILGWVGNPAVFVSSFMMIAGSGKSRTLPSVLQKASKLTKEVQETDYVVKDWDDENTDNANFLAFHKNESNPYMVIRVARNPTGNSENLRIEKC